MGAGDSMKTSPTHAQVISIYMQNKVDVKHNIHAYKRGRENEDARLDAFFMHGKYMVVTQPMDTNDDKNCDFRMQSGATHTAAGTGVQSWSLSYSRRLLGV